MSQPSLFEPSGFRCRLRQVVAGTELPRPSPAQERACSHQQGALLVLGGPGTGKTTALAQWTLAQMRRGVVPEKILVIMPTRRAAVALRQSVISTWAKTSVAPTVVTVHSWCLALLRRFGHADDAALPIKLLTAPEQEFRVREILDGNDPAQWPADLQAAYPTRSFSREVRATIAKARQLALDPPDLARLGREAGQESWVALARFFDEYLDVLDFEHALDYSELVHRARLLLADPAIRAQVTSSVSCVGVDDLQHLDQAQYGLVRQLVGRELPVWMAMDPDQSINSFRGSITPTLSQIGADFAGAQAADPLLLPHTYRGGTAMWSALQGVSRRLPVLAGLDRSQSAALRHPEPEGPGTPVQVLVTDSESAQAEHIADALRRAHIQQGIAWQDMAVISRHGRTSLPLLSRTLVAWGIPVTVAGDEVGLASDPAVRPLLLALAVAAGERPLDAATAAQLLQSPLVGLDSMALRRLGRALRSAEREELAGVCLAPSSSDLLAAALSEPVLWERVAHLDDGVRAKTFADTLHRCRQQVEAGASAHQIVWELWSTSSWPLELREAALRGGLTGRAADRSLDSVVALFELVARKETTGNRGVRDVLAEVDNQLIAADNTRDDDVDASAVSLLTAHRAAGQQWRLVVVTGAQEGSWPDLRGRQTLFAAPQLDADHVGARPPAGVHIAEERRLFYVACSRASEQLIVTSIAGTAGEGDAPSRFVGELGVEPQMLGGRPTAPLTMTAMVAELRRALVDSTMSPALRQAAAVRLRQLSRVQDDRNRPLVPAADPARWWGVRDLTQGPAPDLSNVRLSGSSLDLLLRCPRKWFCERRAHADRPRPGAATLGSVIHVLIEHATTKGWDTERLVEHLDGVWDQLPFEAAWLSAAERVEAEAALERFGAYALLHNDRKVLGVEVPFSVQVDVGQERVTLTGAVDRLELTADRKLLIVDFKTGRSAISAKEAVTMAQLGVYQLAAQQGAFDQIAPTRALAGADVVYLRVNDGQTAYPLARRQPSLDEQPWPAGEPTGGHPTWVHAELAAAVEVLRQGEFPALRCDDCRFCPFASSCPVHAKGRQLT